MRVKASELAGALKAAAMFACTDATRQHIHCIHIEAVGSALRLVATDGHTLWVCEVPAEDGAADPAPAHQAPWNLRLEDVDPILRALKAAVVEVDVLLPKHEIAGTVYPSACEDYAPYLAVLMNSVMLPPGKVHPEFAADYVKRCCEALAAYGKGFAPEVPKTGTKHEKEMARAERESFISPPISWRISGELDPMIVFSPKFPAAFAVVMPRRGNGGDNAEDIAGFLQRVHDSGRKGRAA